MKSKIRIHFPQPGLHNWGIEFNFEMNSDQDASEFVAACRKWLFYPGSHWFYQSGHYDIKEYQMFELLGLDNGDVVLEMAEKIAKEIDAEIVYD